MMSCTETVFYTMSVYFVAAKISKTRYNPGGGPAGHGSGNRGQPAAGGSDGGIRLVFAEASVVYWSWNTGGRAGGSEFKAEMRKRHERQGISGGFHGENCGNREKGKEIF